MKTLEFLLHSSGISHTWNIVYSSFRRRLYFLGLECEATCLYPAAPTSGYHHHTSGWCYCEWSSRVANTIREIYEVTQQSSCDRWDSGASDHLDNKYARACMYVIIYGFMYICMSNNTNGGVCRYWRGLCTFPFAYLLTITTSEHHSKRSTWTPKEAFSYVHERCYPKVNFRCLVCVLILCPISVHKHLF